MRNLALIATQHTDPRDPRNIFNFQTRIWHPENRHLDISDANRSALFLKHSDTPRKNIRMHHPLYLHMHSTPSISLEPFTGAWRFETQQLGFMFATTAAFPREATDIMILQDMHDKVAALNAWFNNDVYALTILDADETELFELDVYNAGVNAIAQAAAELNQTNLFPADTNLQQLIRKAVNDPGVTQAV